jgi:hypothetical protein
VHPLEDTEMRRGVERRIGDASLGYAHGDPGETVRADVLKIGHAAS